MHACACLTCILLLASTQPIGGHVLAHASTTRLYLKKGACFCSLHA